MGEIFNLLIAAFSGFFKKQMRREREKDEMSKAMSDEVWLFVA